MREIKFRAWDEMKKVMHYDFQFIKSGDTGNDWIIFISDKYPLTNHGTNPFVNPNPYFSKQFKIMKHTGFANIYEGDIVEVWLHSPRDKGFIGYKGVVEYWDTADFCWGIRWGKDEDERFPLGKVKGHIFAFDSIPYKNYHVGDAPNVIGNIYENPQLLEAQKG